MNGCVVGTHVNIIKPRHKVWMSFCTSQADYQIKAMGRRKRARSSSKDEASSEPEVESEDESVEEESEEIERKGLKR